MNSRDMESDGGTQEQEVMPYNPKNYLITSEDLKLLLSENGVDAPFTNISTYRKAFVHRSYCTRKNENFVNGNIKCPPDCLPLQECSNETLEYLGDSVLGLAVAHYLYERFPDSEEGFLTKIRTRLVNGQMLSVLSEKIGLDRYIIVSKQIEEKGGRRSQNHLEDVFEALLGAIFMDFNTQGEGIGYKTASEFIINVIENNIDFSELVSANNNYKDMLLKYFQHSLNHLPKFYELNVDNKHNGKQYTVCIKNKEGLVIATGTGSNKKQAENHAARNALVYYGQL